MKKLNSILALLVVALMGLSLAACSKDDLDTNQYQDGVHLNVYGPQPVMRGGELRFLGSNLDQIAQVKIPGCDPITNIEVVQAGNPSEIKVTVPKDGPEEGYVTLVTKTDEEITTKTKLTYKQAIVFESFSSESVMPGETLAIKGDYLNLVHMIEFADGVQVSEKDFKSHTRYQIEVVVPEEARTGKVNLLDLDLSDADAATSTDYNTVTTDKALNVGTPTITKWSSPRGEAELTGSVTAKKGETITITGEHLNLVLAVEVGEDYACHEFNVSEDGKTLTFVVPEEMPSGDLMLLAKSGVDIPVGTFTAVTPSECVAAPSPVKANATLTITGKDLDLVSSVEMPNVSEEIVFNVNAEGTQLEIIKVPETAQEGNLVLRMKNKDGVEVPFKLVKPTVTSYSATNAGAVTTISGTNLDLVKKVQFGEGSDIAEATVNSDGSLTVTIPMNAKAGKPTLFLANGTSQEAEVEIQISEALFCYVTEIPSEPATAGSKISVPVKNGDKLQKVYFNDTEVNYLYTPSESIVTFNIPTTVKASSTVKFESSNGNYEFTLKFKTETTIYTGPAKIVDWGGNQDLAWGGFDWSSLSAGVKVRFYYGKPNPGSWGCLSLRHGEGWGSLPSPIPSQYNFDADEGVIEVEFTAEILQDLIKNGGLVMTGDNAIVKEITVE